MAAFLWLLPGLSRRVTAGGLDGGAVDTTSSLLSVQWWATAQLSTASPENIGDVSVLLTPYPDLKGEGNFCHEGISDVLPRLQIHSQHVDFYPSTEASPPACIE